MVGNVFVLWLLFGRLLGQLVSKMTYYLSRDCQIPLGRDTLHPYRDTAHLRVDALQGGLVIQSHNWWLPQINQTVPSSAANHSQHSVYPLNFSCEIVIHTPVENARIMLRIEEFYVPSASEDCVDNYLYVFDSNTAKSKAMPEAGGERGLCRASYPRFPIFTTKSAICIAFHTSAHLSPVPPNYRPGFRLILTAVHDTTTTVCPQGLFYCGLRPHPSYVDSKQQQQQQQQLQPPSPVSYGHLGLAFGSSTPIKSTGSAAHSLSSASASSPGSVASSFVDRSNSAPLSTSVSSSRDLGRSALGYCIPERTVCDGIGNCADSRDESVAQCGESGSSDHPFRVGVNRKSSWWLLGFLSLGIPASIAIAVSTILTFTVCIGAVICCCNRCCGHGRPYRSRYPRIMIGSARMHALDAALPSTPGYPSNPPPPPPYPHPHHTSGSDSAVLLGGLESTGRAPLPLWTNQAHPIRGTEWNSHVTPFPKSPNYVAFCSYSGGSQQGSVVPMFSSAGDGGPHYQGADQKLSFQHAPMGYTIRSSMMKPGSDSNAGQQNCMTLPPSVGAPSTDSYSSIHASSSVQSGYPVYPRPSGPNPSLIHGAMGSPVTYRRDASGTDPCCYTPPPYGACTVPPASSVTASSSRTGTTSGAGGGVHASNHSVWIPHGPVAPEPGLMTAGGSTDGVASASAMDLCHVGSNGIMFGHQLSGGGNSVLHTNTPVETVSQSGGVVNSIPAGIGTPVGDMMSNGGILYLGELVQPLSSEDASMRFRGYSCGPGSTTTGSGSSHGRKLRSHVHRRLFLADGPLGHMSDSQSAPSHRPAADSSVSGGGLRSRAPSNRTHQHHHHSHRRRYHHRSSDASRGAAAGASSGSHTPASSRSGMPTNSSQRSGEPPSNGLPVSENSVSFPVQL